MQNASFTETKMASSRSNILSVIVFIAIVAFGIGIIAGKPEPKFSYLALGDSYTTGYAVVRAESYPFKAASLLRGMGMDISDPEMIAMPGWTTTMLLDSIRERNIADTFSVVTMLIGANNIGINSVDSYRVVLETLVQHAIAFAGGNAQHVILLSVPDQSVTPHGGMQKWEGLAGKIDRFNAAAKELAERYQCRYLDITTGNRARVANPGYLVADGLHMSAKEYTIWAEELAQVMYAALREY